MSASDEELVERIRRDLADSYDEEARLNCIHHLLGQMPYREVEHPAIVLPPRVRHEDYVRRPVAQEILVPEVY